MNNLVLITSIIKPPETPLSYAPRSVFTHIERFNQTQKTILSIKEKLPDAKIFLVECSNLSLEEEEYFKNNCHYMLNLYYNEAIRSLMHSSSKSLCEGAMTFYALEHVFNNNYDFDYLIKISGRYWLSEKFNYELFNSNEFIVKYIDNNVNNIFTGLYKLPKKYIETFKTYLLNSFPQMFNCVGYEILFAKFIKSIHDITIINVNPIGLDGYVSVSGEYYSG